MESLNTLRSATLIGRDRELAHLEEALRAASRGRGSCLLLLGEAGSGKTRLLREVASRAAQMGLPVLRGEAPAVVASPAWSVVGQALRSFTRQSTLPDDLAPFALGLHQILPEIPAPPRPAELAEDQMRMLILEGALRLVIAAAGSRGAAVLLDDIQDADPESLQFVHHAATAVPNERIVLIAAARTGEGRSIERELRAFEQRGIATVLGLHVLDARNVAALIRSILGAEPPGGLVADVMTSTDGVPLLVEHALDAHVAAGTIAIEEGNARWTGEARAHAPRTTIDYVQRRLDLASDEARAVLTTAAIAGAFDIWLLAACVGTDESAIARALRDTERTGLVELAGENVGFLHALVREAVAALTAAGDAERIRRRAERAILERGLEETAWLEARALHLEALSENEESAALLVRAGRQAFSAHAMLSAESLARRAIGLARVGPVASEARALLSETLGSLGRFEEALDIDADTGKEADPERLARMARHAVSAGRLDEAGALISRAALVGAAPGPLETLSGLLALWRGELERASASASRALELGRAAGDARVICAALDVMGRAADAAGRRDEARDSFRKWAEEAETAGLIGPRLQALMELGNLDFMSGGPADRLRAARDLAQEENAFTTQVLADLSLVWWLGHRAEIAEAVDLGDEAIAMCRRFGLDVLPHALVAAAWARERQSCGSGEGYLEEALSIAPNDVDLLILTDWTRGDSALRSGRSDLAVVAYERAMNHMRQVPSAVPPPVPFMRVAALIAARRLDEVADALEEARASPALARLYVNRMWLAVGEALAQGSAGSLEQAADIGAENGSFNRAVALILGAEVIGGEPAERWLRGALSLFDRAGAKTDAARARKLLRGLGARVPRKRRAAVSVPAELRVQGVTSSEFEVLVLVAEGLSNGEIAGRLFLSIRTVEDKVSSLLGKLGATNRAALIARGLSLSRGP